MKKVLLLSSLIVCFILHGVEQVDEWTGLRDYWYTSDYQALYNSWEAYVYYDCKKQKNNQHCAVISAYLLLEAQEKNYIQQELEKVEKQIGIVAKKIDNKQKMVDNEANFIIKSQLQNELCELKNEKNNYETIKNKCKKTISSIDTQLKMSNLSNDLQDKDTHKKLEDAFNALVLPENRYLQRIFLQCAVKYARNRGKCPVSSR